MNLLRTVTFLFPFQNITNKPTSKRSSVVGGTFTAELGDFCHNQFISMQFPFLSRLIIISS